MKKGFIFLIVLLFGVSLFWLGFGYQNSGEPNVYYQVFLDGELIGTVTSKTKLERYIDAQNDYLKKKYQVDTVYSPNGLKIEKIITYSGKTDKISDIYDKIKEKKAFTIKGYQMTIKNDDESLEIIYATNTEIFSQALLATIHTFVGTENYQAYIDGKQPEITTTGTIIENVYIENSKTLKEIYISTDEKIYIDAEELGKYLIFGDNAETRTYTVKAGDTIENIAFNNKISVEEFLISNNDIKSAKSLLFTGQQVKIAETAPKVKVVVEEYVVEDAINKYAVIEQYDPNLTLGTNKITQAGSDGEYRVTKDVKRVNGVPAYVNNQSKVEIKPTVNQIVLIGKKVVPTIGSLSVWGWPTDGGYTITSYFGYRSSPFTGGREFHDALDIAVPHGSPIYAANNGVVETASNSYINGNYVVINHNNGYYTYYGHMSRILVQVGQTVARGEQIGKIGMTGAATGPHVHFAIYVGFPYRSGSYAQNPWNFYFK